MRRKRDLTSNARELRQNMTEPEKVLWKALRDRRLAGFKFRRQVQIDSYVVDFLCKQHKLIIEVDGDSHADRYQQDQRREQKLIESGYRVVRVSNDDVLDNLEGVLMQIAAALGLDPAAWRDGEHGQLPS